MAVLALTACSKDEPARVHLYDRGPVPAVPDRTQPVAEPLADGQYWSPSLGVAGDTLGFTLAQAFFGPTCEAELGADACVDEPGVVDDPSAEVSVAAADLSTVSVVSADRTNYAVTGAELATLAGGGAPSAEAPDGFTYVPYPFLVTVRDGVVVEARQIWVP
jgi:hypothetical protein